MALAVLIVWIVEGLVGVTLFIGWLRHARGRGAPMVLTHLALMLAGLACWVWFLVTDTLAAAWIAFGVITVGISFGDVMLLRAIRRLNPAVTSTLGAYGAAIPMILRGELPPRVGFHALFSPVVYFSCLGVCIGAGMAAAR